MTAIIIGTYNRGHLLSRSLMAYAKQRGITLIVMDDGSTDNTAPLVLDYEGPSYYFFLGPKTGWRDSASYLNRGIRFALHNLKAQHVFITHPEIIPGATTIDSAVRMATDNNTWVSCKGYYLTPQQQASIETVRWYDDLLNVRKLPGFYGSLTPEFTGNPDYTPERIEQFPVWESWIFGGGHRDMWLRFGELTEFETWGSVDVDLLNRRRIAGINTVTPGEPSDYVVHQNHDDIAQRDMSKCMAALPTYHFASEAFKPELLYEPNHQ